MQALVLVENFLCWDQDSKEKRIYSASDGCCKELFCALNLHLQEDTSKF